MSELHNIQVKMVKENKPDLTLDDLEIFHADCGGGKISNKNLLGGKNLKCTRCLEEVYFSYSEIGTIYKTALTGEKLELVCYRINGNRSHFIEVLN